jgi:hypothetical protein
VPVPSLPFTGDLYDWAKTTTRVRRPSAVPQPGDAVLFGTGPSTVFTSRHVGIVEAAFPGYLVTIEGDSLHGVRRYVVPIRDPQLVGEPGPIYAYASPVTSGGQLPAADGGVPLPPSAAAAAAAAVRHQSVPHVSLEQRRLPRAIAALRAFQHMPYDIGPVHIDWTGVNSQGLVEVVVTSAQPMPYAVSAWQQFLRRFNDAGHAYTVSFNAPPGPPTASAPPTISGAAWQGQTLTESHGLWSGSPTTYSYQWQDCDIDASNCTPISGATGQTYQLTGADVGHTIRVSEVASDAAGAGAPATSDPTPVIAPAPGTSGGGALSRARAAGARQ